MSEVLYHSIHHWLSQDDRKQVDITTHTGVSKTLISLVLEKKGRKDLKFSKSLSIFRYIEEDYLDVVDEYCRSLDKPRGILDSLEYASTFERHELMDDLIAKHKDYAGEVKEWVEVYRFRRDKEKMTGIEALEKCRELYGRITQTDAKIKLDLIEATIRFDDERYNIKDFIKRVDNKFDQLRDGFLKDSLSIRYQLNLAFVKLYELNQPKEAIDHAKSVIHSSLAPDSLIGSAHHLIGHAHMYTNYEESLKHLNWAKLFYGRAGHRKQLVIDEDIQFVMNVNKKEIDLLLLEGEELAHQFIIRGDYDSALRVLDDLEQPSSFAKLYRGMITKNMLCIMEGYGEVRESGNVYFALFFEKAMTKVHYEKEVNK
ncbi:hypothetical protein JCM19046_3491 [Bacillus sp. JCM 19046]|nr:hypothetical protein JCM19045_4284 [Bacillus sp. JCM 19045]GAF18882.1 hypothetical protein JCM19046_3491 [Bacillus sp. JCM 19046]